MAIPQNRRDPMNCNSTGLKSSNNDELKLPHQDSDCQYSWPILFPLISCEELKRRGWFYLPSEKPIATIDPYQSMTCPYGVLTGLDLRTAIYDAGRLGLWLALSPDNRPPEPSCFTNSHYQLNTELAEITTPHGLALLFGTAVEGNQTLIGIEYNLGNEAARATLEGFPNTWRLRYPDRKRVRLYSAPDWLDTRALPSHYGEEIRIVRSGESVTYAGSIINGETVTWSVNKSPQDLALAPLPLAFVSSLIGGEK